MHCREEGVQLKLYLIYDTEGYIFFLGSFSLSKTKLPRKYLYFFHFPQRNEYLFWPSL